MTKPVVLALAGLMPGPFAELEANCTVHRLWEAADKEALIARVAPEIRGIVTGPGVSAELMDRFPALEIIGNFGVGYDKVDVGHAKTRGVRVTNTPGVLDDEVADLGLLLMLATARRLCVGDRFVRAGKWTQGGLPLARSLRGKRLGVVGMGRIGQAVAERAQVFGLSIAWHGPRAKPEVAHPYYPDLVALARDSDVLVLCCPGGAATHHIVNRAVIEALGPDGILVNIARGTVVDEPELVAALTDGRLGAAGLDVFEHEPKVPEALYGLDNVVLQPHVGSATVETRNAMADLVVRNLLAHFAGQPLLTPVA
ncbi:MAG TPA: 2-hydroxyacid dehydrogenase [Inquilinus sp.]|nr:2-hydroxyacid dehydrogenase [Inquilinus sp.]